VERIEPVVQRIEENGFTESEEADAVTEVNDTTSELDLSAAAKMRVKADTVDLLEGRLEMVISSRAPLRGRSATRWSSEP